MSGPGRGLAVVGDGETVVGDGETVVGDGETVVGDGEREAPAPDDTWVFMRPIRYRVRAVILGLLALIAVVPEIRMDLFDRVLLGGALGLMAWGSLWAARNARVSIDFFQSGSPGPDLIYRQAHRAVPLRRAQVRAVRVRRSVVAPWSDLSFELAVEIGGRPFNLLLSSPFWCGGAVMRQARRLAIWAGVPLDDAVGARWAGSRWRVRRWMAAGENWKATLFILGLGLFGGGALVALWTLVTGSPPPVR